MPPKRIAVVGSANTDMIVPVPHLPERGETILGGKFLTAGGGKGANQAVAARRLGADVWLIARVGSDVFGDSTIDSFRREGIRTDFVLRDAEAASGVALILVEPDGENVIAVAPGANARLSPSDVTTASDAIRSADAVLVQLEIPIETVEAALGLAHRSEAITLLNPAPAPSHPLPPSLLSVVDVLNPNRVEAGTLADLPVTDLASAEAAARRLIELGVGSVVVTLGADGALVVDGTTGGRSSYRLAPARRVNAVDAVGAGDAFTAALGVALAGGASLFEAASYANAVAALSTTKAGAQPSMPTADEVEAFLESRS